MLFLRVYQERDYKFGAPSSPIFCALASCLVVLKVCVNRAFRNLDVKLPADSLAGLPVVNLAMGPNLGQKGANLGPN